MTPPLDPSEAIGTPEYQELHEKRTRLREQMLDYLQEQRDYETLQYPQRFSH